MKENVMTSRAIIFLDQNNSEFLSIKRTKFKNGVEDRVYYTFPGGHVEQGESYEQAVIREIKEELGVEVKIDKEYIHIYNEDLKREEKFFICSIISGKLGTGDGPEWTITDYEKYGKYEIVNIKVSDIDKFNILPPDIKEKVKNDFKKY